jgi:hypothetical protein
VWYIIIRTREHTKTKEENKMYETVKTVKGHDIVRMKGTHGAYHVTVREGKGFREFHTFRTIKAAAEFIEKTL